jgi:hypothetical protein
LEVEEGKVEQVVDLALLNHFLMIILSDFAEEVDQLRSQRRPMELLEYSVNALA